jgi:hypothetical protein
MRYFLAVVSTALAAGLLGGCAGGGLSSNSLLPGTSQSSMHQLDSLGGLPGVRRAHQLDSLGGLPGVRRAHQLDSLGGLPGVRRAHPLDSLGGLPGGKR